MSRDERGQTAANMAMGVFSGAVWLGIMATAMYGAEHVANWAMRGQAVPNSALKDDDTQQQQEPDDYPTQYQIDIVKKRIAIDRMAADPSKKFDTSDITLTQEQIDVLTARNRMHRIEREKREYIPAVAIIEINPPRISTECACYECTREPDWWELRD